MGHEYGAQPEQVVKPEEEEMSANTSDSESEIKVEKQDSTEQAGEVDISSSGDHGDILEERDEALPPKVNAETVTVKEGVSKQVIKEGHGLGPPPRHSSCFGTPLYFAHLHLVDTQCDSNVWSLFSVH